MKLSNLIAAGTAATLAYLAVKNRDKIAQSIEDNLEQVQGIQANLSNIQDQLAIIQSYKEPLQEMATDFQYKLRVYQQSIAGNLAQIQAIQEKYQEETSSNL